jgi:glycosyltransferase
MGPAQQKRLLNKPRISIITTCFNSEQTIRDTLQSVANQDYPFIEHILVDGKSTDNTLDIIREFSKVNRLISEKDHGIYDAMNKGIGLATGDFVGFLNSDDFYSSHSVISQVIDAFERHGTDALYGDIVYVHPKQTKKILRTWIAGNYHRKKFLYGWMPPHPAFFVRRELFHKCGNFNTSLSSAADYELMLRFLYKHQVRVTYLPGIMVCMRTGGQSNASLKHRLWANREDRKAWKLNGLNPFFYTTWLKPLRKIIQFIQRPKSLT